MDEVLLSYADELPPDELLVYPDSLLYEEEPCDDEDGLRYVGVDADLVIDELLEADTLEPDDEPDDAGLDIVPPDLRTVPDAAADLETVPPERLTELDALLDELPTLIPPRTVPPDVLTVLLAVPLVVRLFLSVFELSP